MPRSRLKRGVSPGAGYQFLADIDATCPLILLLEQTRVKTLPSHKFWEVSYKENSFRGNPLCMLWTYLSLSSPSGCWGGSSGMAPITN